MKLSFPIPSKKNLAALLTALVFVATYSAGIWYVHHLRSLVAQDANELALETAKEASMKNLAGFIADVAADAQTLNSFFVSPDKAVTVIEHVEGLGNRLGVTVKISNVEIDDKNAQTGEGLMVMSVTSTGSWHDMTQLLALLDTFPSVSRVDSVTLVRQDNGDAGGIQWQLRATMQVWLRR